MITPLLPVFLAATLGAGPAIISLIEGVAEATSSLMKIWSGRLVDRGVPARHLVIGGYAVSVTSRPWIGLAGIAIGWPVVMALRFLDRVGKGLRTSPRDALIADVVPEGGRGRAYGLHRAMDHTGAVIGPLLAAALLAAHVPLRDVFLWALLPGALVIALLWFGLPQESTVPHEAAKQAVASPGLLATWHALTPDVRRLVIGGGLLAVAAVPEVMLVLWATGAGMPVEMVPLMWAAASLAKMAVAYPAGWAVDRFGVRKVLTIGWTARVVMLVLMAIADYGAWLALWLIIAYGMTVSGTEAAERAWIGNGTRQGLRGRAFGGYHMAVGLAALPGAASFGLLWQFLGAPFALCSAAALTAVTALVLLRRAPR